MERCYAIKLAQTATNYVHGLAALQPMIVRSSKMVREYAERVRAMRERRAAPFMLSIINDV